MKALPQQTAPYVLLTRGGCPACQRFKAWLDARRVNYVEVARPAGPVPVLRDQHGDRWGWTGERVVRIRERV